MKPSFFSGCRPEKIQVEFYPIFFRVAKALIFSKLKIGCRLKGRLSKSIENVSEEGFDKFIPNRNSGTVRLNSLQYPQKSSSI